MNVTNIALIVLANLLFDCLKKKIVINGNVKSEIFRVLLFCIEFAFELIPFFVLA